MTSTVDYSSYIIDLCTAMLDNSQGLTDSQVQRISMIRRQTVNFITDYLRHESSDLPQLLHYLDKEAVSPLRIVIGCSDMILSGKCGDIQQNYGEAIGEIRDCGYAIYDDVEDMHKKAQEYLQKGNVDIAWKILLA